MRRVCVVCEGQTEATFVKIVLREHFCYLGLTIFPQLIESSPGHMGGALTYERVKKHLVNILRGKSPPVVTTMFDLYRLNNNFPGFADSLKQNDLRRRLGVLQQAFHEKIVNEAKCRPEQFIPYFQPYEFEPLLFSDLQWVKKGEFGWESAFAKLAEVRQAAKSPEHINDRPESTPSAHLGSTLKPPKYRKRLHGPIAAREIGIDKIASECSFFAAWLNQLRNLAVSASTS